MDWINKINTTNLRILLSLFLATELVISLQVALLVFGWKPTAEQKWVLLGIAGGILTMMGYDVLQFASKRFSDERYQQAKNSALPPPAQVSEPPRTSPDRPPPGTDPDIVVALESVAGVEPAAGRVRLPTSRED